MSPNYLQKIILQCVGVKDMRVRGAINKKPCYWARIYYGGLFLFCIGRSFRSFINKPIIARYFMIVVRFID